MTLTWPVLGAKICGSDLGAMDRRQPWSQDLWLRAWSHTSWCRLRKPKGPSSLAFLSLSNYVFFFPSLTTVTVKPLASSVSRAPLAASSAPTVIGRVPTSSLAPPSTRSGHPRHPIVILRATGLEGGPPSLHVVISMESKNPRRRRNK